MVLVVFGSVLNTFHLVSLQILFLINKKHYLWNLDILHAVHVNVLKLFSYSEGTQHIIITLDDQADLILY